MAIPGLLIEYLISGMLTLIWLYPLVITYLSEDTTRFLAHSSYLPLFVACLYVIGMIIDYIAWLITKPFKNRIRRQLEKRYTLELRPSPGQSHIRKAKFAMYAPEIAKESAMRASRDRIARGIIVNSIIATIVYSSLPGAKLHFALPIGVISIIMSSLIWGAFEKVSYGFELRAEQAIDEKIEREKGVH
jgi:hypothetical protein